jgi:hypothetical protein
MPCMQSHISGHDPLTPVPFPRSSFVMPVSDAFRSRREGKRGLRTFCGFARQPTGISAPEREGVLGFPWRGHEAGNCALR